MAPTTRKNASTKGRAKSNKNIIVIGSSSDGSSDDGYSFKDLEHYDFDTDGLEECSQPVPSGHESGRLSGLDGHQRSNSFTTMSQNMAEKKPRTVRHRAITAIPKFKAAKAAGSSSAPTGLSRGVAVSSSISLKPTMYADRKAIDASGGEAEDVWWRQYEPQCVEDLGVHNGKTAQVRGWLEMASRPAATGPSAYFRILVVEGPAGAGKSTCVRVVAKELGLGIVEWVNPLSGKSSVAGALGADIDEVGVVDQFAAFLKRAERFTSLRLDTSDAPAVRAPATNRQIILVDDLPNISHRDTRESFKAALLRFISVPARQSFPLVIIVTESFSTQNLLDDASGRIWRLREDDKSANSEIGIWCASDIIPRAVYGSACCQSIKFNPVAPTIVAKGLKRILQIRQGLEGQRNVRFSAECTAAVRAISGESGGDMRSAIIMLQLTQAAHTGTPAQSSSQRKRPRATKLVTGSDVVEGTNVAATRHVSLDLFHALGKVLYAKRGLADAADDNSGRGRLESNPSKILDCLPLDVSTFSLYVHENSVDFCSNFDELTEALGYFSDADMISSRGRAKHGAFQTAAEIYAGMLTTHGFMHAKGHPELAGSGMSLHDQASQGSHRGSIQAFRKPMFFESYRKRVSNSRLAQDPVAANMLSLGAAAPALGGWGARMIDTLAFWAQIVPGRVDGSGTVVRQRSPMVYQQLVDLAMTNAKPGYQEQADQAPAAAAAAAALPGAAVGSAGVELQKLVLSDDDIEDFSE